MQIPMTQHEIASFLEVPVTKVHFLWRIGRLEQSFHDTRHPAQELGHSTVYDVLEYALVAGALPVTLTKELAALWVAQLAEADTCQDYRAETLEGRICLTMEMAVQDGLADMTDEPAKVAAVVVATQAGLIMNCENRRAAV